MIDLCSLRHVIERMLRRDEILADARSPLGAQLEHMSHSLKGVSYKQNAAERAGLAYAKAERAHEAHDQFAFYAQLAALLTKEEEAVLRARYTPASPDELALRMPPETNEERISCWWGDVETEDRSDGTRYLRFRGRSVIIIHRCSGPECERDDCEHVAERTIVSLFNPKDPSLIEVARRCQLSVTQVRRRIEHAHDKIRDSLEQRAIRGAQRGEP